MTEHSSHGVEADNYFAIIPEWVLYSEMTSNAVRLYGALRRHADQTNQCFPSRRRLATLIGVSESTLDRAMKELVDFGAVEVTRRVTESGDFTSNQYLVRSVRGVASPVKPPGVMGEPTGGVTSDELTKAIVNESQELELMLTETVSEPVESDFDRFWAQYPRKVGKQKAQKAWGRLTKKEKIAIFGVLDVHVSQWRGVRPEFVPHATSWLNGRRWEDELDVVSPVVRSRSAPGMGVLRHIMSYNNEQGELQ